MTSSTYMEAYMQKFLEKFQHLKIQLEEIKTATNNFNKENYIGVGGFGKVYKGEVSHSEGRGIVAIKRLDHASRQGAPEFLKEITMLSDYKHENVISLLGFCCEGGEMILVYELASRGSLDRYLKSPHLTWRQRLKICIDAAKGLSYLHDPRETHRRLIHCDVKSGNILLDDQWNAKVADLGLSMIGSANEQLSLIVTAAAGTGGYIDPVYWMTNTLTKESDIYSFGVVLFEVLCGTLCCRYSNGHVQQNLVPMWIESYKEKKLTDIIFKDPNIQAMDQRALEVFSDIAYRCLKESREDRPMMAEIVTELEIALDNQEFGKLLFDYEEMTNSAEPPLSYRSKDELMKLLTKGVILNGGKRLNHLNMRGQSECKDDGEREQNMENRRGLFFAGAGGIAMGVPGEWFSVTKKGEHLEMISFVQCLDSVPRENRWWLSNYKSRFDVGPYEYSRNSLPIKVPVRTLFVSPGITYTVNLVFKFSSTQKKKHPVYIGIKYKLQGETQSSTSHLAYVREDGWWMAELYQITTDRSIIHLEILFDNIGVYNSLIVEGIEFRPLEKEDEKLDMQPISDSDSDANWEEKLPTDYKDIIKRSKNSVQWTTKEEAYSMMCRGFLIDDGEKWFSLDKNGKKCHMQSAVFIWRMTGDKHLPLSESRFGEVFQLDSWYFYTHINIQSQLVSSQTTYASYLVYKVPDDQSGFDGPIEVKADDSDHLSHNEWYIYLVSPQTPIIKPKADENTHKPVHMPKLKGLPQLRNDGWMEVRLWEFQSATSNNLDRPEKIGFSQQRNDGWMGVQFQELPSGTTNSNKYPLLTFTKCDHKGLKGLIIAGIEYRPV